MRLRLDAGEHPRRSGSLPRMNIGCWGYLDNQVEGVLAARAGLPNVLCELEEQFGSGDIDREKSIPSDRSLDGPPIGPVGRDPDRDPRTLDREWTDSTLSEFVESVQAVIQQARAGVAREPLRMAPNPERSRARLPA